VDTNTANPPLDDRFAILGSLQTLLDQTIAELASNLGAGRGIATWFQSERRSVRGDAAGEMDSAAWTLKARYYMHTASRWAYRRTLRHRGGAERHRRPFRCRRSAFIPHRVTAERNMWSQFQSARVRHRPRGGKPWSTI